MKTKHIIIGAVCLVSASIYISIIIRGPNGVIIEPESFVIAAKKCDRHDGVKTYNIYSSYFRGAADAESILVTCHDDTARAFFIE